MQNGKLTLHFDGGALVSVTTRGVIRKVIAGSGRTSIAGAVTASAVNTHKAADGALCLNHTITSSASQTVYVSDCFAAAAAQPDMVEWESTISSDSSSPFSVPMHRNIVFETRLGKPT